MTRKLSVAGKRDGLRSWPSWEWKKFSHLATNLATSASWMRASGVNEQDKSMFLCGIDECTWEVMA
jgi:hypothetical protein